VCGSLGNEVGIICNITIIDLLGRVTLLLNIKRAKHDLEKKKSSLDISL
jgi:hypothetical protein